MVADGQAESRVQLDGTGRHDGKLVPSGLEHDNRLLALLLESPAWIAVQQLMGQGAVVPPERVQVALRPPEPTLPSHLPERTSSTSWHIDGLTEPVTNRKFSGFTLLVGIALSDVLAPNNVYFTVFPGSHRAMLPLIQQALLHGPACSAVNAILNYEHRDKPRLESGGMQLLARKGDVVLAHQKLAHCGGPNNGTDTRIQVYYRLSHHHLYSRLRDLDAAAAQSPVMDLWAGYSDSLRLLS